MNQSALHYIYDPLCGWCYAASPLVQAAREVLPVVAHGGGMLTGARRRHISPEWRGYVLPKDRQLAKLTSAVFGEAYREVLLRDTTALLDSEPPTTAVLAAEQAGGRGLDLLQAVQKAYYVQGRRVADPAVLAQIAAETGLDESEFRAAYATCQGEVTNAHFAASRALLDQVGGDGFPTFVLERGGHLAVVEFDAYFRDLPGWKQTLQRQAAQLEA